MIKFGPEVSKVFSSTYTMHNAFSYLINSNKYIFAGEVPMTKCLSVWEISIPNMYWCSHVSIFNILFRTLFLTLSTSRFSSIGKCLIVNNTWWCIGCFLWAKWHANAFLIAAFSSFVHPLPVFLCKIKIFWYYTLWSKCLKKFINVTYQLHSSWKIQKKFILKYKRTLSV